MGRAERRRAERANRIADRKSLVMMSKDELRELKEEISKDRGRFDVESLMTCFALAEHRMHKFGYKRILRTLQYVDELAKGLIEETATLDDYARELEEETGIVIKCDK